MLGTDSILHEYAPLHTNVEKIMIKILEDDLARFRKLVNTKCFRFCSHGGGPGSEAFDVLAALNSVFVSLNRYNRVSDCKKTWSLTFISILPELRFGCYGTQWQKIATNLNWNYIGANLCRMTEEVNKAIASASVITMVKFLSASTCTNTEGMVDKIFRVMKPGALLLFIDNAEGGFTQIVERAARKNGLVAKFDPLRHEVYEVEDLKVEDFEVDRFGHSSCFKTKVTIILLQKALSHRQIMNNFNPFPNTLSSNVPTAKPISSLDFVVLDNNDSCKGKMLNINNNRPPQLGKMLNIDNNRPPQLIKQTSPDLKTKKPSVPSAAVEQNKVDVSKSKTKSTPGLSTFIKNDLFAKVDNLKPGLQKANESAGQLTWNISATKPGNRQSSSVDSLKTAVQSSATNNSGAIPEQKSPKKPVASKSSVRNASTSAYKPLPKGQPARKMGDSSEGSCGCCVIS